MTIVVQITGESAHDVLKQMAGLVPMAPPTTAADNVLSQGNESYTGEDIRKNLAVAGFQVVPKADKPEVITPRPLDLDGGPTATTLTAPAPTVDGSVTTATKPRTRKKAEPASTEPTELDKQEAAVPLPAPKIEDVRAAMKALAQSKMPDMNAGTTLVEAVLRQFGVMKASDVPDAERLNFIAECAKKAAA